MQGAFRPKRRPRGATRRPRRTALLPQWGAPVATMSVRIGNHAFHPAAVIVEAGGMVTWTQEDTDVDTVHFGGAGGFTSRALQKGRRQAHLQVTWNLAYICSIHP